MTWAEQLAELQRERRSLEQLSANILAGVLSDAELADQGARLDDAISKVKRLALNDQA